MSCRAGTTVSGSGGTTSGAANTITGNAGDGLSGNTARDRTFKLLDRNRVRFIPVGGEQLRRIEPGRVSQQNARVGFCTFVALGAQPLRRFAAEFAGRAWMAARAEGNFLVLKLFLGRETMKGRLTPADVQRLST